MTNKWDEYQNLYMHVHTITNGKPYGKGRLECQIHISKDKANTLILTDGFSILDCMYGLEFEDAKEEAEDILFNLEE